MIFCSTRDTSLRTSLADAVGRGLAPDGGLYIPCSFPKLTTSDLSSIRSAPFVECAALVAQKFFEDDISAPKIKAIVEQALNFQLQLIELAQDTYVLELFHGPTLAFKDVGARFMAGLLRHLIDQTVTVLAATSGDTGSAVASAFEGQPKVKVVVLFPRGRVSEIQELQMTTIGGNVLALEVQGSFDDCQRLVKTAFCDAAHREKNLTSANSISIARLLPQCFYYAWAWGQLAAQNRDLVFSVPCGNLGNLTAGMYARKVGIPMQHFVAAHNANTTFPEYLKSGRYVPRTSVATISNAMDVGDPSNFERLKVSFAEELADAVSGFGFSDVETEEKMRDVYQKHGYVLDPHSAVGMLGLDQYRKNYSATKVPGPIGVVLGTAHPVKFSVDVERVLGVKPEEPACVRALRNKPKHVLQIENDYQALSEVLGSHS